MALPVYRYPLDPTGINRDNLILREPHELQPKSRITDVRVAAPLYGPVYSESVIIYDANSGRKLDKDIDYKLTDLLQTATLQFALPVTQFVVITNGTVSNNIDITYQCVGGNYQNDSTAVLHAYETFLNDARAVDWEDITGKPQGYPPSPHIHLLEDVIGWGPMLWALDRIREAILLSNSSVFENFLEWFKYRPVDWNLVVNRPTTLEGYGITDAVHVSRRIRTINGIQGGGTLANDLTLQLTITGVEPGIYGTPTQFPTFTVDDRGRLTRAALFDHSFLTLLDKPTTLAGYGITDAVNTFGNQGNINGQKVWRSEMIQEAASAANTDAYRISDRQYGAFWRMETGRLWLLLTNSGDSRGLNNAFRPFWVDLATGEVHIDTKLHTSTTINGNAASADKLATPRKISLSTGATGEVMFDGSRDVTIPVLALDVSRVNAGVLLGTYGGTGLSNFTVGQYFVAESLTKMKQITPADMMTDIGKTRKIIAGLGLTGGGDLSADVTITMAPPTTLTGASPNAVTAGGHTHALAAASTTIAGVVRRATDQEVTTFTGDGVVSPPQLRNLVAPATVMPKAVTISPAIGTSTKYAREDHVHTLDRKMAGGFAGFENVTGTKVCTAADLNKFFAIGNNGAQIILPDPTQLDPSLYEGMCVDAWVLGYGRYGIISFAGGWGGGGYESYNFYSTITAILAKRTNGNLGWYLTDDGHTIYSESNGTAYQYSQTRLGNPANSSRINGTLYMDTFSIYNVAPGSTGYTQFRKSFSNGLARCFASVTSGSSVSARVVSANSAGVTVAVDAIGQGASWDNTVQVIAFGSYTYNDPIQ